MPRKYPTRHREFLDLHRHNYDALLEAQGGTCALCPRKPSATRRLDLDHRHTEPMIIRGLLCWRCNRALKEWMTEDWLEKAARYANHDALKELLNG